VITFATNCRARILNHKNFLATGLCFSITDARNFVARLLVGKSCPLNNESSEKTRDNDTAAIKMAKIRKNKV